MKPLPTLIITFAVLVLNAGFLHAQSGEPIAATKTEAGSTVSSGPSSVLKRAEIAPRFSGNWSGFLQQNLRYPELAKELKQEGRATVVFTVLPSGLVTNAYVKQSTGSKTLDHEALRVTRLMEKKVYWSPAIQNGVAVPMLFSMPVEFRLQD